MKYLTLLHKGSFYWNNRTKAVCLEIVIHLYSNCCSTWWCEERQCIYIATVFDCDKCTTVNANCGNCTKCTKCTKCTFLPENIIDSSKLLSLLLLMLNRYEIIRYYVQKIRIAKRKYVLGKSDLSIQILITKIKWIQTKYSVSQFINSDWRHRRCY